MENFIIRSMNSFNYIMKNFLLNNSKTIEINATIINEEADKAAASGALLAFEN